MKMLFNVLRVLATLLRWKCLPWLPGYFRQRVNRRAAASVRNETVDIMFLVVDHFEPSRREGDAGVRKVRDWCERYEQVAGRHRDSDGIMPQHTWFYRYDYPNYECLRILSEYVYRRCGEIEFHLHHGHDNSESFSKKILNGVKWFNQAGAMISAEPVPRQRFGYIAGNWALDNGRFDPAFSGCNNELEILGEAGCYADFTFPAFGERSQPSLVNTIYHATDTPAPKSYNTGHPLRAGKPVRGDLVIIPGPLYLDWQGGHVEYGAFEGFSPYTPERLARWQRAGIHVEGQPSWLFIKLHTHGMQSHATVLGDQFEQLLTGLESRFMREPYRLHYVTAREAYNIARAAEAGMCGNPHLYRDFEVKPPANRLIESNVPYRLREYSGSRLRLEIVEAGEKLRLAFSDAPLLSLTADSLASMDLRYRADSLPELTLHGRGQAHLCWASSGNYLAGEADVSLPFAGAIPVNRG